MERKRKRQGKRIGRRVGTKKHNSSKVDFKADRYNIQQHC